MVFVGNLTFLFELRARKTFLDIPKTPTLEMATHTQLDKLNKEISDAVSLIAAKEEKREKTDDVAEKAIILESIAVLNARLDARSATRDHLLLAAVTTAPGKNTPSRPRRQRPPSTREHAKPPARCRVP